MKCDAAMAMILSLLLAGGASHLPLPPAIVLQMALPARPGPSQRADPGGRQGCAENPRWRSARKSTISSSPRRSRSSPARVERHPVHGQDVQRQVLQMPDHRALARGKVLFVRNGRGRGRVVHRVRRLQWQRTRSANAPGGNSSARPEPAAAVAISDKVAKRFSMAIGEETDRFMVTQAGRRGIFRWHEGHRIYGQDGWWKDPQMPGTGTFEAGQARDFRNGRRCGCPCAPTSPRVEGPGQDQPDQPQRAAARGAQSTTDVDAGTGAAVPFSSVQPNAHSGTR